MPEVLIVGASRGIGLGLVDVHLETGWDIHTTTRDGLAPRDHPAIHPHLLDVRIESHLETLLAELNGPVNRIIHNAGILRAPRAELMAVNARAPMRIVEALLEAGKLTRDGTVAVMTSQIGARRGRQGSLGDYGDSKADLNDRFRSRSDTWRELGAIAVVIHPGWVQTDMGGSSASLTVRESVEGIKRVLDGLTESDHGSFLTWDGRVHPW